MEQNRLKELILFIRKSKHNMFKKVETFTLAILDKGSVDMDTHELSNLVKDTFTKRRAKEFYADVFSSVIGESNGAGTAPTFACNKTSAGSNAITPSTWTLGSEIICNISENGGHFDPYVVFLTDEQKSKLQITINSNIDELSDLSEELQIFPIPDVADDSVTIGKPADCHYMFYGNALGAGSQPDFLLDRQLLPGEYIKITITYDGVDYVYLS